MLGNIAERVACEPSEPSDSVNNFSQALEYLEPLVNPVVRQYRNRSKKVQHHTVSTTTTTTTDVRDVASNGADSDRCKSGGDEKLAEVLAKIAALQKANDSCVDRTKLVRTYNVTLRLKKTSSLYKCFHCDTCFTNADFLELHEKSHTPDSPGLRQQDIDLSQEQSFDELNLKQNAWFTRDFSDAEREDDDEMIQLDCTVEEREDNFDITFDRTKCEKTYTVKYKVKKEPCGKCEICEKLFYTVDSLESHKMEHDRFLNFDAIEPQINIESPRIEESTLVPDEAFYQALTEMDASDILEVSDGTIEYTIIPRRVSKEASKSPPNPPSVEHRTTPKSTLRISRGISKSPPIATSEEHCTTPKRPLQISPPITTSEEHCTTPKRPLQILREVPESPAIQPSEEQRTTPNNILQISNEASKSPPIPLSEEHCSTPKTVLQISNETSKSHPAVSPAGSHPTPKIIRRISMEVSNTPSSRSPVEDSATPGSTEPISMEVSNSPSCASPVVESTTPKSTGPISMEVSSNPPNVMMDSTEPESDLRIPMEVSNSPQTGPPVTPNEASPGLPKPASVDEHRITPKCASTSSIVRTFECDVCSKRFRFRPAFNVHKRTHDNCRPYRCGECGRQFISRTKLFLHSYGHARERRTGLRCGSCCIDFVNPRSLLEHLQRGHATPHKPRTTDP